MHITIITPSFNQLGYLKRCIASVRDQVSDGVKNYDLSFKQEGTLCADLKPNHLIPKTEPEGSIIKPNHLKLNTAGERLREPISVHHHIQDALSSDGTREFLEELAEVDGGMEKLNNEQSATYQLSFASEADTGMYDALNKGVEVALAGTGRQALGAGGKEQETSNFKPQTSNRDNSITAWLNCDEQYLAGTLQRVADYFAEHPNVDILTGNYLLVDEQGSMMAYRKGYQLRKTYVEASHLYTLSCATFYRQRVFEAVGKFDDSFKAAADEDFILRALRAGYSARHMRSYLSVFTYSGDNLGAGAVADREHLDLKRRARWWVRVLRPAINAVRLFEKWLSGAYRQQFPLKYSIYAGDAEARKEFVSQGAGWKWPGKAEP